MAGLDAAYAATQLDAMFVNGDYIAWSTDGATETGMLARTAVVGWNAAVSGNPATKSNSSALTTANASGSGAISHYRIVSASTGGTVKTEWKAITGGAISMNTGDSLNIAAGAIVNTLD